MANPQCEKGFIRISNELLNATIIRGFSKRQIVIILFIWRLSYGFNSKETKPLKFSDFTVCGVGKGHIKKELEELERINGLIWNRELKIFSINKDFDTWLLKQEPSRGDNLKKLIKQQLNKSGRYQ